MDRIVNASPEERKKVFQTTAAKKGIGPEMIEKDFWVCRILQKMFQNEALQKILCFKGGTSLSKVFHLIQRFSEDVDLILDWRCVTQEDPRHERSKTKQNIFNETIQKESGEYISGELQSVIASVIDSECSVVSDETDKHVLLLEYPKTFPTSYIAPHIRLEIGPLAAWSPNEKFPVLPYIAECFPDLQIQAVSVPTILAERTFWEKVTILHQEHFRSELRDDLHYSRHYYDLFMMARSSYAENAIKMIHLLKEVVDFKKKFYPRAWAQYDLAVPGSIELLPAPLLVPQLRADYESMRNMIFGEYPSWDEITETLTNLQSMINSPSKR